MTKPFEFLKHRRATENETRDFYERRRETLLQANARNLKGKERFAFICEQARELQLYYSRPLDCVMFSPTDDEAFKHWCRHNDINATEMPTARKAWNAAIEFYRSSNYDEETLKAVRAGEDQLRRMKSVDIRERCLDHQRRYS